MYAKKIVSSVFKRFPCNFPYETDFLSYVPYRSVKCFYDEKVLKEL